jgi:hypothetical protein
MTKKADQRYRFSFRKLEPKHFIKRDVLLDQLCKAMLEFRNELSNRSMLKVVQLGDFVDLWREQELVKGEAVNSTVRRILNDNPEAHTRLIGTGAESLTADLVRGNHDWRISESDDMQRAKPAHVYAVEGKETVLVTHGHFFDWVEDFQDELQEAFVEAFGPKVDPDKNELDRTKTRKKDIFIDEEESFWGIADDETTGPQGEAPIVVTREDQSLPTQVNVWVTKGTFDFEKVVKGHKLMAQALTYAKGLRKGTDRHVNKLELSRALPDLRTMVIGHSHFARICIHSEIDAAASRFVLVDCGAWIEYTRFGKKVFPACQIGVLCGGDVRIYQLDPHEDLLH